MNKAGRNPDAGATDALRWTWEKYKRLPQMLDFICSFSCM